MKKNIFKIIKEEFDKLFEDLYRDEYDTPSISDKYYEKITHQPRPEVKRDNPENGQLFDIMSKSKTYKIIFDKPIKIFKNPKSLNEFEKDARGVLLENGDLYLSESNKAFHQDILDLLSQKGLVPYKDTFDYDMKMPESFIAVIRVGNSNMFIPTTAYDDFPIYYETIFDMANNMHSYKFKGI